MLNPIGTWSSSKGMVKVPNLSGLTREQAMDAIDAAGLTIGSDSSTTTGDNNLNNKIASQSPNANELVEYESLVSFIYYSYTAPVPSPVSPVGVSPVGVSPVGVSPVGVTPSTTWYCSAIERVSGADYTRQFTETTDHSGTVCEVQTIVCSTSGYPAYPTIQACTPSPVSPVGVSPVGATGSVSMSISSNSSNAYTLSWSTTGMSQVSYKLFFNGAGFWTETDSGTTGSSSSGTVTGTTGTTVYWYVQVVGSDGYTYNSNTVSLTIQDTSVSPVGVSPVGVTPVGVSPVPASEWYCSELSFLGTRQFITTYDASAETCDQFKRVCWEVPPNTGYPAYPTSYPSCSVTPVGVTPVGVTPVGVTPVGVTPVGVSPGSPCPAGQEPWYGSICNCEPYCGLPYSCGTQGACEIMGGGSSCFLGCI